jgi:hypothetical protein
MSDAPQGGVGGEPDSTTIHVDHGRGTQVGDWNTQDNRSVSVAAGRDAISAGRDVVQHFHYGHPIQEAGDRADFGRGGYLQQVLRIAPLELVDRDGELAELARFCLAEDAGPYV